MEGNSSLNAWKNIKVHSLLEDTENETVSYLYINKVEFYLPDFFTYVLDVIFPVLDIECTKKLGKLF